MTHSLHTSLISLYDQSSRKMWINSWNSNLFHNFYHKVSHHQLNQWRWYIKKIWKLRKFNINSIMMFRIHLISHVIHLSYMFDKPKNCIIFWELLLLISHKSRAQCKWEQHYEIQEEFLNNLCTTYQMFNDDKSPQLVGDFSYHWLHSYLAVFNNLKCWSVENRRIIKSNKFMKLDSYINNNMKRMEF